MTTWDDVAEMWRVEVINRHGETIVRWFNSWHRAERYRLHIERGGE